MLPFDISAVETNECRLSKYWYLIVGEAAHENDVSLVCSLEATEV